MDPEATLPVVANLANVSDQSCPGLGRDRFLHRAPQSVAEPLRGTPHRLAPARVSRSRSRPERTPPAPPAGFLLRVLSPGTNSPCPPEGCAGWEANRGTRDREGRADSRSWWPA